MRYATQPCPTPLRLGRPRRQPFPRYHPTLPGGPPRCPLLDSFRHARGPGRDDHPIAVLWGVVLLTIVLRHVHCEACLAELRRNDDLRALLGIPRDDEEQVPD